MKLTGNLTKNTNSLNGIISPRAGGGRVNDVTYNDESVVNDEGVAIIPPYPSVPVKGATYNNQSIVNENGVAIIPPYPTVPVKDVEYNNQSVVNENGVAIIPESIPRGVVLWEGDFIGDGSIIVPNISEWLLVMFLMQPETSVDYLIYASVGTPARGGMNYGAYGDGNVYGIGHRFGFNKTTNTLTVDNQNRGIYMNGTTHDNNSSCHIRKIIGLIKVPQ